MLSHNSDYGESEEFVQYGPSKVGLTDCGFSCKIACGCNNDKGWYLAVPDGNYDTKKSARTYDYIIDDDGKLASSGTTLSSAGRTLSGSTKSLSAGGSTITCTKQTCSDGYTATEPLSYFDYVTETLRHGQICYKVTGCKKFDGVHSYYANKNIASGTGATSHNGIECYDVLCSDENANWLASKTGYDHYTNISSQSSYGNTCYTGRYHNITWCPSGQSVRSKCPDGQYTSASQQVECTECDVTGDDICRECSTCPTKVDVGSCEVGTTTNIAASQDECGTYYTAKRNKNHAEACGSDYTSVPSGYHCDSYTSPCGFTCYNNCEKHNYSWCDTTNGYSLSSCGSGYYTSDTEDVECTKCSSTSTSDTCYKCAACPTKATVGSCEVGTTQNASKTRSECGTYYTAKRDKNHSEACGTDLTSEPDDKDCKDYTSCGFTCYKECKDKVKYYTVSVSKTFGSSCSTCGVDVGCGSGSGVAGAFNGISCSLSDRDTVSGTSSNSHTISNVKEGTTISCNDSSCYQGAGFKACINSTSGGSYSNGTISTTVNSNVSISFHYECEETGGGSVDEETPTWYTEVLDKEYEINNGAKVWTSHISRACIAGPTSKSASINLECKVSFSGGIDPNYAGGFNESTCSGGEYHDSVQISISAGEQRACEVVYETPCLDNEIECEEI